MHTLSRYFFIALLFIVIVSSHLTGFAMMLQAKPSLFYIILFFFSMVSDSRMGYILIFLLGIIEDSLSVRTLGISSLLYLSFSVLVSSNSRALMKQRFNIVWGGFAGVYLAISLINELLQVIIQQPEFSINISFWKGYLLTILCYPLFHTILTKVIYRLFSNEKNFV